MGMLPLLRFAHYAGTAEPKLNSKPMDEQEFKQVYEAVNDRRCVFEKAALTRMFACEKLIRMNIAEREAAGCSNPAAQSQCHQLLNHLRASAAFALKLTHVSGPLPHAKELKVQCGGLLGLQRNVEGESDARGVTNVFALVQAAKQTYGELAQFPYQDIVKSVAHFQGRRPRRRS